MAVLKHDLSRDMTKVSDKTKHQLHVSSEDCNRYVEDLNCVLVLFVAFGFGFDFLGFLDFGFVVFEVFDFCCFYYSFLEFVLPLPVHETPC